MKFQILVVALLSTFVLGAWNVPLNLSDVSGKRHTASVYNDESDNTFYMALSSDKNIEVWMVDSELKSPKKLSQFELPDIVHEISLTGAGDGKSLFLALTMDYYGVSSIFFAVSSERGEYWTPFAPLYQNISKERNYVKVLYVRETEALIFAYRTLADGCRIEISTLSKDFKLTEKSLYKETRERTCVHWPEIGYTTSNDGNIFYHLSWYSISNFDFGPLPYYTYYLRSTDDKFENPEITMLATEAGNGGSSCHLMVKDSLYKGVVTVAMNVGYDNYGTGYGSIQLFVSLNHGQKFSGGKICIDPRYPVWLNSYTMFPIFNSDEIAFVFSVYNLHRRLIKCTVGGPTIEIAGYYDEGDPSIAEIIRLKDKFAINKFYVHEGMSRLSRFTNVTKSGSARLTSIPMMILVILAVLLI